jgi:hypothetical protein
MKIVYKIFLCVKTMSIRIIYNLSSQKYFINLCFVTIYAHCGPEPNSKGGLIKSGSIVDWFQGPTDN